MLQATPLAQNSSAISEQSSSRKTVSGVIERITFQSEETGYTVARFLPDKRLDNQQQVAFSSRRGEDKLVTVVGTLLGVAAGEALELNGVWQHHSQHGWQFKVENYRSVLPATAQGIRKYIGSGLIKGIGPKTAERIVDYFGVETMDILESSPHRLGEVPRLGQHKANLIAKAWLEQKAIKEVMVFLQGQGISTSLAVRIYKQYEDAAITIVKNQPYRLAREVWGIGFKTADKIAQALGFKIDDPERLKAGTLFVLGEATESGGHTYLPRPMLAQKAAELLEVSVAQVEEAIDGLIIEEGLKVEAVTQAVGSTPAFAPLMAVTVFEPGASAPQLKTGSAPAKGKRIAESRVEYNASTKAHKLAPGEEAIYLPPFYYAEQGITRHLLRLSDCAPAYDKLTDLKFVNHTAMFDYLSTKNTVKLDLAERQREGVVMALTSPVAVLTGGPGTGKTTSMQALVRVLTLKKKTVVLAAPTGRAAKRLSEATGLEAKTLHRLLQIKPGGQAFYNQDNPIPADMVIVDEVSMLDTLLMNNLLKSISTGTHLLLVGDADQLPSVGAGNVLADVIGSGVVPVVRLDQIFRQSAGSAIVTNAHRINQGQMPLVSKEISDFFLFVEDDAEKAGDLIVDLVTNRIPAKFGFSTSDIQVLAPMHRGKCGVAYLNEQLQASLNPESPLKPQKQFGGKVFRVGDKVIQLRNNYDKEVFNGDGGVITNINSEEQTVAVNLDDGRTVEYEFTELDELTLAYTISIHKSQGSDYPVCVIPMVMSHYMLLERKLLYTAVTRAKKLVVLVGSKKALGMAVRNGSSNEVSKAVPINEVESATNTVATNSPAKHQAKRYTGLLIRLQQSQNPRPF